MPVTAPLGDGAPTHLLPGSADQPLPYLEFEEKSGMGRILQAAQVISAGSASLRTVFRSHLALALLSMARAARGVCWPPRGVAAADLARDRKGVVAGPISSFCVDSGVRCFV